MVVITDFSTIVHEVVSENQNNGGNKNPLFKESLKLESMILLLWFLRRSPILQDENIHRLFLDYIHEEYYDAFKRNGYNFEQRKAICDLLNERYLEYDMATDGDNFPAVSAKFCRHLSENSDTELDMTNLILVAQLLEKEGVLLKKYREQFGELGVYTN